MQKCCSNVESVDLEIPVHRHIEETAKGGALENFVRGINVNIIYPIHLLVGLAARRALYRSRSRISISFTLHTHLTGRGVPDLLSAGIKSRRLPSAQHSQGQHLTLHVVPSLITIWEVHCPVKCLWAYIDSLTTHLCMHRNRMKSYQRKTPHA